MYKLTIINISNIDKLKKQKLVAFENFIKELNKYWDNNDTFKNLIDRLKKRKMYNYYYIFLSHNEKIIGGFRYFKKNIEDKILFNRFVYKNGTYYHIQEVFVINGYRGKGILDKLFKYFFHNIGKNKKCILAVDKENKFGIKAYERNKFKKIIERKVTNKILDNNIYSEKFTEYLMLVKSY